MRDLIQRMITQLEAGRLEVLQRALREERWSESMNRREVPEQIRAETRATFVEVLFALAQNPADRELARWHLWIAHARFEGEVA